MATGQASWHPGLMVHSGDMGGRLRGVVQRRWPWLAAVTAAAGAVALPSAVILAWLSPVADGQAALRWAGGLWLALTGAGVALVAVADQRPGRRVVLAVLGGSAAMLLCAVPVGTLWTFGVDHGPAGAECPECAVTVYLAAGPLAVAPNELAFRRLLCDGRRDELGGQAAAMARDVEAAELAAGGVQLLKAEADVPSSVDVNGDRAAVAVDVALKFTFRDRQPGGATGTQIGAGAWTFTLVQDDGWRVCQVDAPVLCQTVLRCEAAPPTVVSPSPTAEDLLRHPREMLPCGPRDPFPELHNCPGQPATPR
ncbi:hypothetical protein RB614_20245 [Phytohabitans sp. ZYX-F-186]|uniref:SnoaL-like domain-containing protein n=1 Tax=Phytohabitans maris TaxID=3071409 RepID=A0ABU0ZKD3_9ACTN|nr:hypothetical protein [Phytohabitans sp. ZYX-F-186]MDQ7906849.1 hypothetical protein [Phytohabitans sp. ZYX-F-186]